MRPESLNRFEVEARFRAAYAALRAREGRGGAAELLALPYVVEGPWSRQWKVRARTYERFVTAVIDPLERASRQPLRILDLGAGNGWLCYRLGKRGHQPIAVDWRSDDIDGLGAARGYTGHIEPLFARVAASFQALPFRDTWCDLVVFNASLHYAVDLAATLAEATRVLHAGGRVVILDSPFYRDAADGEAMVAEKRNGRTLDFGAGHADLLALPSVEYLTADRLAESSSGLELHWRRHAVRYPMAYELRPMWAALRGRRRPSRFDLWEGCRRD